ncbi:eRF1 domain 1-domain-containing protein [Mycena rosella]|uniref:ERF1 domain 1-domain-containing protein n=1 Tax=Mycena rosella TaxID=1033263 RepID=A0AAD7D8U2_MYCRO|nr:eRF1 domain 1-domain-containing protein [Mycena rosella]
MKLVNKHIDKHGTGHVTIRPEDDEDMWHLYNLIQEGDSIRAPAIRRVQKVSSTGSVDSQRVKLNLTLKVTRVEFQTAALHISGPVVVENQHVRLGAFHTLDIEVQRDVRIEKFEGWDSIAISRVEESIIPGKGAEVAALVCGEGTVAFCLLSQHMTVVTHRLAFSIPRKSGSSSGATQHEKGLTKFYGALFDRAIVIASPGWVRDAVYDYMVGEASRRGDKVLQKALRDKVVKVHISSPHVLKSPEIVAQLKETKFAREGIVLDKFFKMLGTDEMRACTLLISDELFRASNPVIRKKYVGLVEAVQQKGGEVVIFSSMHESGQQLNQLTGLAAILTFPLDIEIVEAEEKEEAERIRLATEAELDVG